jgi:hypothetical protein
MSKGAKTYWEQSCPDCGKPEDAGAKKALNIVGYKRSKKDRCRKCHKLLNR